MSTSSHSCNKIAPDEFRNEASQRFTRREVRKLTHSSEMEAFAQYSHERESLLAVAIIAPLCLLACFYCDLIFGLMMDQPFYNIIGSAIRSTANDAPLVRCILRILMSGFVLPCAVLVPFCGVFRDVSQEDLNVLLFALTAVMILLSETPERSLPSSPSSLAVVHHIFAGVATVAGNAGYIIAAYLVSQWRSTYWKRAVRIPAQLLTVPLLLGVFGWLWNRYAALVIVSWLPSHEASRLQLLDIISGDVSFLLSPLRSSGEVSLDSVIVTLGGSDPAAVAEVWITQCFVGWICIVFAVLSTPMTRLFSWVGDGIIPVHPSGLLVHGVGIALSVVFGATYFTPLVWLLVIGHVYCLATVEWSADD
ncbi:transmembrane protein, putative [Bodo saltans]|uniref:Transmembrane protein, putative n=1 Tax=Bodo saltans TaxID=75058 RepID=A0A0S4JI32_BODSA|nr:transmembrane protein, putative [Bodo saltans]|eukprot:CUG88066.1 transmembrane protein, putative [Bodo saltans]